MKPESTNNHFANTGSASNQVHASMDITQDMPSIQSNVGTIIRIIRLALDGFAIKEAFDELTKDKSIYRDMSSSAKAEIHSLERRIDQQFKMIEVYTGRLNNVPPNYVNLYVNKINSTRLEIAKDMESLAGVVKGQLERLEKNSSNTYYDAEQLAIKLSKEAWKIRNDPKHKVPKLDNLKQNSQALQVEEIASSGQNGVFEYKLNELSAYSDLSTHEKVSLTTAAIWHQSQSPEVAAHALIAYLSPRSDAEYLTVSEHLKVAQEMLESQDLIKPHTASSLKSEMSYE